MWAKFGEDDPHTLRVMDSQASMYKGQGRLIEAEELQSRVMERIKVKLVEYHPDTLTSMANMASIWKVMRWPGKAEAVLNDCFERRQRLLGPNHPDAVYVLSILTRWKGSEHGMLVPGSDTSSVVAAPSSPLFRWLMKYQHCHCHKKSLMLPRKHQKMVQV